VDGGSREYVKRLTASYADKIRREKVIHVTRLETGVALVLASGATLHFDEVVIATHADEALALLSDPTTQERETLGAFRYTENETYLHNDATLMPKRERVWSSWNYLDNGEAGEDKKLTVSYWMNELQGIDKAQPLFVTLNPHVPPRASSIIKTFSYQHPLFDRAAMKAQHDLWSLQGQKRTWFCGSYFGYGFHEDALQAGLAVAESLSGEMRPWTFDASGSRIHVGTNTALAAD
jgi:predicted NAD/FAD-binding protein